MFLIKKKKRAGKALSYTTGRRNTGQPLWKVIWEYVSKSKMHILFDPATALLGMPPQICFHMCIRVWCMRGFTAASRLIGKDWKQAMCPIAEEWWSKLCHTHTMKLYAASKKNEANEAKKVLKGAVNFFYNLWFEETLLYMTQTSEATQ